MMTVKGKNLQYPVERRLGGSPSRSGRGGGEEKFHSFPCQDLKPDNPAHSPVTTLTELPRLHITHENNVLETICHMLRSR